MPQMSPINWMMLSTMIMIMWKMMKVKMNNNFYKNYNKKMLLNQKKMKMLW